MRVPRRIGTAALLVLLIFGNADTAVPNEKQADLLAKIFFVKFKVVTDAPITMDNIEKKNRDVFFIMKMHQEENKLARMLEEVLTSNPVSAEISKLEIRLKVEFVQKGETFYVDKRGVVLRNGRESFKLSPEQMDRVEDALLSLSGIVDMKANKKIPSANKTTANR